MLSLLIINGPSLNLLSKLQTEIYGEDTFEFYDPPEGKSSSTTMSPARYCEAITEANSSVKTSRSRFSATTASEQVHWPATTIALADAVAGIRNTGHQSTSATVTGGAFRHHSYRPVAEGVVVGFWITGL
jgi:3-dehydroquinate dehydratase